MERFPALRLILGYGRVFAALAAAGITGLVLLLVYPMLGLLSLAVLLVLFPFAYLLVKSYVEIVQIVTEMVH